MFLKEQNQTRIHTWRERERKVHTSVQRRSLIKRLKLWHFDQWLALAVNQALLPSLLARLYDYQQPDYKEAVTLAVSYASHFIRAICGWIPGLRTHCRSTPALEICSKKLMVCMCVLCICVSEHTVQYVWCMCCWMGVCLPLCSSPHLCGYVHMHTHLCSINFEQHRRL